MERFFIKYSINRAVSCGGNSPKGLREAKIRSLFNNDQSTLKIMDAPVSPAAHPAHRQ
jgi:hypothetical protein